jgi:hypothetical protein
MATQPSRCTCGGVVPPSSISSEAGRISSSGENTTQRPSVWFGGTTHNDENGERKKEDPHASSLGLEASFVHLPRSSVYPSPFERHTGKSYGGDHHEDTAGFLHADRYAAAVSHIVAVAESCTLDDSVNPHDSHDPAFEDLSFCPDCLERYVLNGCPTIEYAQ